MSDSALASKGPEDSREFVARLRRGAPAEGSEAQGREWSGRSPAEHGRVLVDLLRLASAIPCSRLVPAAKSPLPDVPPALRKMAVNEGRLLPE